MRWSVRVQVAPNQYRSLPIDAESAMDLAEAMALVRRSAQTEHQLREGVRKGSVHYSHVQGAVNERRAVKERAMELFSMLLDGGIDAWVAEHGSEEAA